MIIDATVRVEISIDRYVPGEEPDDSLGSDGYFDE